MKSLPISGVGVDFIFVDAGAVGVRVLQFSSNHNLLQGMGISQVIVCKSVGLSGF